MCNYVSFSFILTTVDDTKHSEYLSDITSSCRGHLTTMKFTKDRYYFIFTFIAKLHNYNNPNHPPTPSLQFLGDPKMVVYKL